ncbi:MAG: formate dehydrogenase accessory sulfurtransferase FdhD, partial [Caldilineae bacterium]
MPAGANPSPPAESPFPAVACSDPVPYLAFAPDEVCAARKSVVLEGAYPFWVNSRHWLTVLCSPTKLRYFALGFLYNEGIIATPADVLDVYIAHQPEHTIRVVLKERRVRLPRHPTLTGDCGGGITFVDLAAARRPVHSARRLPASQIQHLMTNLLACIAPLYQTIGGFHTAALSNGDDLLAIATDIGRHNTLDKIAGECLARGIPMEDAVLLTTGRISAQMLGKVARMHVPIVATINSPTHLAIELAQSWNITLIGYARGATMHLYTGAWRIQADASLLASRPAAVSPSPS